MNQSPGNDRKRLRVQEPILLDDQPRLSFRAKAKCLMEKPEAFLLVRIVSAVDVDREFRAVTNERFYGVMCWINPGEEYLTRPRVPNVFNFDLDPVWDELITVPLGEASLDEAVLHLDVLRGARAMIDPGSSNGRKLVGRAEFSLNQLQGLEEGNVKLRLELMEPVEFRWKPEGYIFLEIQLVIIPTEQPIEVSEPELSESE